MKNYFFENGSKSSCNGCGVCSLKCPRNAIKMIEDNEGFFYPQINQKKCVNCGKCKNICGNYNDAKGNEQAYMAINKNKEELKRSASGGIFYILAKYTIEKNGIVFGVEYGNDHKIRHNFYEDLEECKRFQGSKYVRSDIGNSYEKVEEFLKKDRYVLFTGTPCQCNALKTYLGKEYQKLIICDIICHANPSQKIFDKYINEIEDKENKKIIKFNFRDKTNGWKNSTPIIYFNDGSKIEEKSFYNAFVGELFNRPSCHDCKFSSTNRVTDFTIGDFWGIDKIIPKINDDDTGISLMTVNTEKAKRIFEEMKENLELKLIDKEIAFTYNHHSNKLPHENRQKFFDNLDSKTVIENINDCLKVCFLKRAFRKCKKIAKKILKR